MSSEDLDQLLLDNLDTFDKTAGSTKHNQSSSPHESNNHSPDTDQPKRHSKRQLKGYQSARFSSRPQFDAAEEVRNDAESDVRDLNRNLKSELIRDSENMLKDIETLYDDHISHYEDDFVTKSDDLCDALSKIDALNIKEENKQFLIRSMEPEPYNNPLEPPKYKAKPNKLDVNSEQNSTLNILMEKRRLFAAVPTTRASNKPDKWKPNGIVNPRQRLEQPKEVVKGETIDAYADFKRGAMSPQEKVMENIKNLREGDDEIHQVMPSKAKQPRYAPEELDEPLERPRGIFTKKLLENKSIKEPPKPMMLPEHCNPAPFTYMNSSAPVADLADIKAHKKMTLEPTNLEVSDDTPLKNGVKRGSVKNLASMFNRCMSPVKGDKIRYRTKRERHLSDGFSKMKNCMPLTRSRSLVFGDDETDKQSIRTCISTNDLTCSTRYDDNTDRDVDTSIMDDTHDSRLFNDRMLIYGRSLGKNEDDDEDEIDLDDCPSSASLSRAVSPVQMVRRNKDFKHRESVKKTEERRPRFSLDQRTKPILKSVEPITDSPVEGRNEPPQRLPKNVDLSPSKHQTLPIHKKQERKTRFSNNDMNIEETRLLSTIISEPTPSKTATPIAVFSATTGTRQTQVRATEPSDTAKPSPLSLTRQTQIRTTEPSPLSLTKPSPISATKTSIPIPNKHSEQSPPITTFKLSQFSTTKASPSESIIPAPVSTTRPDQLLTSRQSSDRTRNCRQLAAKDTLPPLYKTNTLNFDMSKPPTFTDSEPNLPQGEADLNSSQSSCSSLKENDCLNQYRVTLEKSEVTEEEYATSDKEEDKLLTIVSNNSEENIPFSITEYQKMFKEKQQQKKPSAPGTRKRFMRQQSQVTHNYSPPKLPNNTSHTKPHNAPQKPRGLVKSSSVQESRVTKQG